MYTQTDSRNFIISPVVIWVLVVSGLVLTTVAAFTKILHLEIADALLPIGLLVYLPAWLIVLGDMIAQKLRRKPMWIIGMLFIPWLAMLLYLLQRERLLRMADRMSW